MTTPLARFFKHELFDPNALNQIAESSSDSVSAVYELARVGIQTGRTHLFGTTPLTLTDTDTMVDQAIDSRRYQALESMLGNKSISLRQRQHIADTALKKAINHFLSIMESGDLIECGTLVNLKELTSLLATCKKIQEAYLVICSKIHKNSHPLLLQRDIRISKESCFFVSDDAFYKLATNFKFLSGEFSPLGTFPLYQFKSETLWASVFLKIATGDFHIFNHIALSYRPDNLELQIRQGIEIALLNGHLNEVRTLLSNQDLRYELLKNMIVFQGLAAASIKTENLDLLNEILKEREESIFGSISNLTIPPYFKYDLLKCAIQKGNPTIIESLLKRWEADLDLPSRYRLAAEACRFGRPTLFKDISLDIPEVPLILKELFKKRLNPASLILDKSEQMPYFSCNVLGTLLFAIKLNDIETQNLIIADIGENLSNFDLSRIIDAAIKNRNQPILKKVIDFYRLEGKVQDLGRLAIRCLACGWKSMIPQILDPSTIDQISNMLLGIITHDASLKNDLFTLQLLLGKESLKYHNLLRFTTKTEIRKFLIQNRNLFPLSMETLDPDQLSWLMGIFISALDEGMITTLDALLDAVSKLTDQTKEAIKAYWNCLSKEYHQPLLREALKRGQLDLAKALLENLGPRIFLSNNTSSVLDVIKFDNVELFEMASCLYPNPSPLRTIMETILQEKKAILAHLLELPGPRQTIQENLVLLLSQIMDTENEEILHLVLSHFPLESLSAHDLFPVGQMAIVKQDVAMVSNVVNHPSFDEMELGLKVNLLRSALRKESLPILEMVAQKVLPFWEQFSPEDQQSISLILEIHPDLAEKLWRYYPDDSL